MKSKKKIILRRCCYLCKWWLGQTVPGTGTCLHVSDSDARDLAAYSRTAYDNDVCFHFRVRHCLIKEEST